MARGYERLELEQQVCFALYAASRAIVSAYGPLLRSVNLTYPQYLAMLVLWEDPETPLSVGDLCRRLRLDTGTLTPLLKRLEALGHVRRERDTADERRVFVSLTDGGLRLRDEVGDVPAALGRQTGLNGSEAKALRDQLNRLVDSLDAWPERETVPTAG